jgi:MFS family permease
MHFRRIQHSKVITRLGVFYLFLSIGISLVSTIWSVYLNSFLHNSSLVGLLTSFFMITEVLAYIFLIPLIEKGNKMKMLLVSLIFFVVSYLLFSIYSNIYLVIFLGVFISIVTSLRVTLFGLIVRDKTADDNVSKNEGIIYSLLNSAWVIGPLVAGYFAKIYGFKSVFFLSSIFILISLFSLFLFKIKDNRRTKKVDHNMITVVLEFFEHRGRTTSYFLSIAVNFWWAFIYIYMPLYIISKGYSGVVLGVFLAGITLPLIFFDYFFGKLAGKRGFKKLFFVGFITLGILSILCFFISNIYVIIGLLMLASISVSMIEPTTDAYFLDIVKEEERDKYFGVYTTSMNIGNLLGSLPAAVLLLVLPFKSLFIFYGIPMIILAFLVLRIEDTYEFLKKKKK